MDHRKPYPRELRERAARMVLEWRQARGRTDGGIKEVAEQLGVHPESVRNWVYRTEVDAGGRPGLATADKGPIPERERENLDPRRGHENPQAAGALVWGGARPPTQRSAPTTTPPRGPSRPEP